MKFLFALASLLTATTFLPSVLSAALPHNAQEVGVIKYAAHVPGATGETHVPRTNAERIRKGLPLLPPTRSRNHGSPTRRDNASPVPLTTYLGYIEARGTDGSRLGYLDTQGNFDHSMYSFTSSATAVKLRVEFSIPTGQDSGSGLSILAMNSELNHVNEAPWLGFASPALDATQRYGILTTTTFSSGTPSSGINGKGLLYSESSVWSVNLSTGEMTATWTDSTGTAKMAPFLNVGGPIAFGADYAGSAYVTPMTLYFVSM